VFGGMDEEREGWEADLLKIRSELSWSFTPKYGLLDVVGQLDEEKVRPSGSVVPSAGSPKKFRRAKCLYIQMEYCEGQNLKKFIKD
jgi:hypothetical protein